MNEKSEISFSRLLLSAVMREVSKATSADERKAARVRRFHGSSWEFWGPKDFYWHGRADNAYEARANGWQAWLDKGPRNG